MREPGHISKMEMQRLLRQAFSEDPEKSLIGGLARLLQDPAMRRNTTNRPRVHPLLLALGLSGAFVCAVFLYFSFSGS
jgi:hypothetical protein